MQPQETRQEMETRERQRCWDSDLQQTKGRIFITSQDAKRKQKQSQTAKPTRLWLKTESATVAYRPTYGADLYTEDSWLKNKGSFLAAPAVARPRHCFAFIALPAERGTDNKSKT